ncbi:MAG TPA: serine/threonine-protein kinase [Ktedonobacteraceae bacterium]
MQDKALPTPHLVPAFKQVVEGETDTGSAAQAGGASLRGEAPLSGQQLGRYTLIRQLGKGGYASIYLGVHHYLNIHVALKLLNRFLASYEDVKRFQMEARILAHLRHRHIVRVLDFGVERSTPFLATEYAPGGNLQQSFPQGRALPISAIMPVVFQVASALQYVHNQGFIHCDVKPENMLLGPRHEIWLSDFGIALTSSAMGNKQFMTHELKGSANYMAPEQISGDPMPASDQYALAVKVYQWLSGQQLFEGSGLQVCLKHLSTPPPLLRDLVPSIPPTVERVVLKALAKYPSQRFAHVQEFAYALKQASRY